MVVLNRIYTRTGDDGSTALGSGARRKKYDLRVSAYGTLDEVNAVIGIARLHAGSDRALDAMLARIQNDLFDVEADLCLSEKGPGGARMTVTDAQVVWLEQRIDELNADLAPLRSFILPGGRPAAAYLHLARTVCRRAERVMVELRDKPGEEVTPAALKYVNRLSDFLFVAGLYANDRGAADVLWQPGQDRWASNWKAFHGRTDLRRQSVHAADQVRCHLDAYRAQSAHLSLRDAGLGDGSRPHDRDLQPDPRSLHRRYLGARLGASVGNARHLPVLSCRSHARVRQYDLPLGLRRRH